MTTDDLFRIPRFAAIAIGVFGFIAGMIVSVALFSSGLWNALLTGLAVLVLVPGVLIAGLMAQRLVLYTIVRFYWYIVVGVLVLPLCWLGNRVAFVPPVQINVSSSLVLAVPVGIAIGIVVALLLMTRQRNSEPQPKPQKPETPIDRARQVAGDARSARQRIPD